MATPFCGELRRGGGPLVAVRGGLEKGGRYPEQHSEDPEQHSGYPEHGCAPSC